MSYLKDLPCAGCGTESTYYFPDKPTAHYCYCEFRHEIGEQIAREIEAECGHGGAMACGIPGNYQCSRFGAAAIAKREFNQTTKDAIEEARKMNDRDELLAKIDDEGEFYIQYLDCKPVFISALRAVVELHKPHLFGVGEIVCSACEEWTNEGPYQLSYPCPTIQAIEKELK